MNFKEILQDKPNGAYTDVEDVIINTSQRYSSDEKVIIASPELELFCNECNGVRNFVRELYPYTIGDPEIELDYPYAYLLDYLCSNCKTELKYFALQISQIGNSTSANVYKFGELPSRINNLPTALIKLFGSDKDLLIKGKNCETQGLGIGAMVYYRRIVENKRNNLFDLIIKALKKIGGHEQEILKIEAAKSEIQFTKSIEKVKKILPQELFIDGHNPLTLLHSAVSKGVHNLSDEECLEIATSIRIVLTELINRIAVISSNEKSLKSALANLDKLK